MLYKNNIIKNFKMSGKKGFTLIEILIYCGIVSVFVTVSLLSAYQIIEYSSKLEKRRELNENHRFLIQKLGWVLSGVTSVNYPQEGIPNNALSINKINFSANPIIIDSLNGAMRIASGGGPAIELMNNNYASVSNLLFEQLNFDFQYAIKVTGTLSNDTASVPIDSIFYFK